MAYTPQILKDFPTPWHLSMGDEIKNARGVWICKAGKLAPDIVDLANEYSAMADEYEKLRNALKAKDEAMGVLFERLAENGIDTTDLVP